MEPIIAVPTVDLLPLATSDCTTWLSKISGFAEPSQLPLQFLLRLTGTEMNSCKTESVPKEMAKALVTTLDAGQKAARGDQHVTGSA